MGLFSKLFKRKKKPMIKDSKCQELLELKNYMDMILSANRYIARSEYDENLFEKEQTVEHFISLIDDDLIESFCVKNDISLGLVADILLQYDDFDEHIDLHNETYIEHTMQEEEEYLDSILYELDPKIILDEEQRRVILTDEDYCLVVASAGTGKTTTIAAKVKYLVEKKKINPSQILVVSFTNKAVEELREKINEALLIDCPIETFHSIGNAILKGQTCEKRNIVDSSKLYFVIQEYFKKSILKNQSLVDSLLMFFNSYFDTSDAESSFNNFEIGSKKFITMQNEMVRSKQEVEIANFLYRNSIEYDYERRYKYDISSSETTYKPDFTICQGEKIAYIEHFGITQNGKNDRFSDEQLSLYIKAMNDKINHHKQHGTTLIYTFSKYLDGRTLLEHLEEELEDNGFELYPRSNKEMIEDLVTFEENKYIKKIVYLISDFIGSFKRNGFTAEEFDQMYYDIKDERTKFFVKKICYPCYLEYERYLEENNAVDFEDMINESAMILQTNPQDKVDYKYIIVDEYQDISRQRFDFVTALSQVTNAKIVAVGDDWQSIYSFSGSDITLFTKFEENMGYAKQLKLVKTYRNSQEIIDIAGNFIQKNDEQISKELQSTKSITNPVIIYTYDDTPKRYNSNRKITTNYAIASAVEEALGQIIEFNKKERKQNNTSVLLLGRFGFERSKLEKTGLFESVDRGNKLRSVKYPKLNLTFMTIHASKGLGYDNVIVLNGQNATYGFPSNIEDDPVLAPVRKIDSYSKEAEERRLFYVAMTRTKNRVYFIAPKRNPSKFLIEIKRDYGELVELIGEWQEEVPQTYKKTCPICNYPLQKYSKEIFGTSLFICTNNPKVCGFMTNEYKAGKLSICKCDQCSDGYLMVKFGKNTGYFLGCQNYKSDKTGCNRIIWKEDYYKMHKLSPDLEPKRKSKSYK